ncbi:MAG: hypothetical protein H7331_05575 [Bacteroidia bacterium]|nr:hypothetical protein [Bacteroidia bacterium]
MKNKTTSALILATALCTSLLFTACRKENKTETASNNNAVSDASTSEAKFDNSGVIADAALAGGGANDISGRIAGTDDFFANTCATLTWDTISTPKKITVDFGATNCLCKDGINRRGKMIITYNGKYRTTGSINTITFNDFYEEDNKIEGTKTVTNNGLNGSSQMYWSIVVTNGKITYVDGTSATWASNHTRTLVNGQSTVGSGGWVDDEYEITGSGGGTSTEGVIYIATILTPLHKKVKGCKRFTSGVLEIVPTASNTYKRQIDFGSGACDNQATVTVFRGNKTNTYIIKFKK